MSKNLSTKQLLACIATGVIAVSCTLEKKLPEDPGSTLRIGFTASAHRATKASVDNIDSAKLRTYVLTAYDAASTGDVTEYIEPEDFGYGINPDFPDGWNTATTHFWPQTATSIRPTTTLSFFTWGPKGADITYDANGYRLVEDRTFPTLGVTVRDTYGEQTDMLAAMSEYETYIASGVTIVYNHILSAVTFSATAESDTMRYVVKDIRVGVSRTDSTAARLYPSGTYHFARYNDKGTWDGHSGTRKQYSVGLADRIKSVPDTVRKASTINLTADDGMLMLVPQELEKKQAYFCIIYDVYDTAGNIKSRNVAKFGALFTTSLKEWQSGVKYNYIITIPEELFQPITYRVTVNNWTEQDVIVENTDELYTDDNPEKVEDGGGFGKNEW